MIDVVIVDDHPLVRRGIQDALCAAGDIQVVGETGRAEEILGILRAFPCDVLLLDLSLPGRSGFEALQDVRREFPALRVLVVSAYAEAQYGVRALRAGAAGYVNKASSSDELVRAVRSVRNCGQYVSEPIADALVKFVRDEATGPLHQRLSNREFQILRLLTQGRSVSAIGAELSLSVKTVSTYRARVLEKLHAESNADLVRYVIDQRLFDDPGV
jgi:two-component system invasion response regulator UvrY